VVGDAHPLKTSAACQSSSSGSGWSVNARGTVMALPAKRSYPRPPAEVVGEVVADAEAVVGRDGDVASVVETVDVGAKQQAVGERVRAAVRVGAHVRGLERRQGVLARDGAGAVGAGDGDAEGALTEARLHGLRRAVAVELIVDRRTLWPQPRRALQALGQDAPSVAARDVDRLAALDAWLPVGVVGDPVVAGEEHPLRDHDAADLVVLGTREKGAHRAAADRLDARRHLGEATTPRRARRARGTG